MPYFTTNIKGFHKVKAKNPSRAVLTAIKESKLAPLLKGYAWHIQRLEKGYYNPEKNYTYTIMVNTPSEAPLHPLQYKRIKVRHWTERN